MGTGKKGTTLSGTGPGPQTLIGGDAQLGFFGEVSSTELFTTDELSTLVKLSAGSSVVANPTWLKFAYKGKILFIAKTALRNSVTWPNLYYAGLVDGTDDNGPNRPYSTGAASADTACAVNQYTVVDKAKDGSTWSFIVRLVQMFDTPISSQSNGANDSVLRATEWNDLIYSVHARTTLPVRNGRFFNYQDTDLILGTNLGEYTMGREVVSSLNYALGRTGPEYVSTNYMLMSATQLRTGWRPVLELIRGDVGLINPIKVSYLSGSLIASSATATLVADDFLWTPYGITYSSDGMKIVGALKSTLQQSLIGATSATPVVNDAVYGVQLPTYKLDTPLPVGGLKPLMQQSDSLYSVYTITNVVTN